MFLVCFGEPARGPFPLEYGCPSARAAHTKSGSAPSISSFLSHLNPSDRPSHINHHVGPFHQAQDAAQRRVRAAHRPVSLPPLGPTSNSAYKRDGPACPLQLDDARAYSMAGGLTTNGSRALRVRPLRSSTPLTRASSARSTRPPRRMSTSPSPLPARPSRAPGGTRRPRTAASSW